MPHLPFKCLSFGLFLKQYFNKAWKQTKFKPLLYFICLKKTNSKCFTWNILSSKKTSISWQFKQYYESAFQIVYHFNHKLFHVKHSEPTTNPFLHFKSSSKFILHWKFYLFCFTWNTFIAFLYFLYMFKFDLF